ncbi:MAG: hypothetical protein ACU0B9_06985 [Limimaricola soesokkakensis]|uniref:hypothetical protein n=1 Tax=Limimaricola soesokkakensis TaxID=1343159 RepID=UPI00405A3EB7
MKYTVHTRHFAAGRFWNKGDEREADPAEVAPQVQRGVLEPVKAESAPEPKVEPEPVSEAKDEPKAKTGRKAGSAAE